MKLEQPRLPASWKALGCVSGLIGIAFWVALGYVAWHFIAKHW